MKYGKCHHEDCNNPRTTPASKFCSVHMTGHDNWKERTENDKRFNEKIAAGITPNRRWKAKRRNIK